MSDEEIVSQHGDLLASVAARSVKNGIAHGAPLPVDPKDYPEGVRVPRATFVTLEHDGVLRGCIGSVVPRRSLVEDVAGNAFGAGFGDPRFPPVAAGELEGLSVGISILTPFESVAVGDEEALLAQARVGLDGYMLSEDGRRGLFLPQVWEALPSPRQFFEALREKAGFPRRYWSPQLHIERFQVIAVPKQRLEGLLRASE